MSECVRTGRRVHQQHVVDRRHPMAGRTVEASARQTGDLLFESGDARGATVRHAERSVDRWQVSNRFGHLPNRSGDCVRTKTRAGDCSIIGVSCRGANHSDAQHYQCCSGFYIDIFNILKDRLKFEFELYEVPDRTWGARNPLTVKARACR